MTRHFGSQIHTPTTPSRRFSACWKKTGTKHLSGKSGLAILCRSLALNPPPTPTPTPVPAAGCQPAPRAKPRARSPLLILGRGNVSTTAPTLPLVAETNPGSAFRTSIPAALGDLQQGCLFISIMLRCVIACRISFSIGTGDHQPCFFVLCLPGEVGFFLWARVGFSRVRFEAWPCLSLVCQRDILAMPSR